MEKVLKILRKCIGFWISAIIFYSCSIIANASTNVGSVQINSSEDVKSWYLNHGITCTDAVASTLYNSYFSQYDNCLLITDSGYGYYFVGEYTINGNTCTLGDATYSGYFPSGGALQGYNLANQTINWATYFAEVQNIDFENIYYDPSIPTPIFSVYYNDDSTTLPRFNADIELQNASSDLYAYVTMDNATPISYGIAYDLNMYNIAYHKFATRVLVSMQSLTQSDSLSTGLLSGIVASGWRNDISTIDDSDVEVSAISDGAYWTENSAGFIATKVQLLNFRKIALFYGNSNTISVQYFRIIDGHVYAGEVKSWNNLNGGVFTVTIPKYYIPNNPANGFEVVTIERPIETANPLTTIPENQFGYRTGGDINISVGSLVPNYPDYPTVATYNLDNILVSTIDNAKHLGNFFTEISGFCVATFAWIPKEIWQIVALGFALSIVVMFVKIL